jgi:hypothetical protein
MSMICCVWCEARVETHLVSSVCPTCPGTLGDAFLSSFTPDLQRLCHRAGNNTHHVRRLLALCHLPLSLSVSNYCNCSTFIQPLFLSLPFFIHLDLFSHLDSHVNVLKAACPWPLRDPAGMILNL